MPFRVNHNLGPNLDQVVKPGSVWYDNPDQVSPVVGDVSEGDDGHKYVWVRATAAIAAASPGTQVTITEPAMTAASGSGGFRAPDGTAVDSGDYFWARQSAL